MWLDAEGQSYGDGVLSGCCGTGTTLETFERCWMRSRSLMTTDCCSAGRWLCGTLADMQSADSGRVGENDDDDELLVKALSTWSRFGRVSQ